MAGERLYIDPKFFYLAGKANLLLLSGQPTKPVDAVFLNDHSFGDYTNLFELAAEIYREGVAKYIATPKTDGSRFGVGIPGEASYGQEWNIQQLLRQGIPIEGIAIPEILSHHTREENDSFLDLSQKMGWRSGVIITHPHHLLRATLGMVCVINSSGYLMEIYTAAPTNTPWYEAVRVNQGIEEKPRIENIDDELKRVYNYQKQGDLATFAELFAYLEARDRGSLRFTNNLPPD